MRNLIIYVGNFSEPENNAAGKRVYGNSLILESIGYNVLLVGKTRDEHYSGRKRYTEHISFESFPEYGRIRYNGYLAYLKEIVEKESPVCIIRYGAPGLSFFDKKLLNYAHKKGIKVIADVVDWLSASGNSLLFNVIKTFDTYMEKAVFNNKSDGVIAISSFLGEYYQKRVNNVVVIPPIVPEYKQNISRNKCVNIMYGGGPFRMGVRVKDVHKVKDRLDLAIEAFAEVYRRGIQNFKFKIYGITKEEYLIGFPDHKEILENIDSAIVFFGWKTMLKVQEELTKSDFSILIREVTRATTSGFPTKVAESISCSTPVITTRTSDLDKYIKDGVNGFFLDISDKEKIVETLIDIINMDVEDIQRMKCNCYRDQRFLPSSFKEPLLHFMNEVLM